MGTINVNTGITFERKSMMFGRGGGKHNGFWTN
jgi:hypothetical protein